MLNIIYKFVELILETSWKYLYIQFFSFEISVSGFIHIYLIQYEVFQSAISENKSIIHADLILHTLT